MSEALEVADKTLWMSIPDGRSKQTARWKNGKAMTMTVTHRYLCAVNGCGRNCAKPKCHTAPPEWCASGQACIGIASTCASHGGREKVKFKVKSSCCENAAGGFFFVLFFFFFTCFIFQPSSGLWWLPKWKSGDS